MPSNALAVYVPIARHVHRMRMLVNDDVMRGVQDFTATLRVQHTSEQNPLYVLPDWVSHVVILLPGGKEVPLPGGYTANFETVFMNMSRQSRNGKGTLPGAFTQIAAQCVSAIHSTQ